MTTYSPAHRKYYLKNKDTIFRKTQAYKKEYNKVYHLRKKLERQAAEQKALKEAMFNQSLDNVQKTQ